MNKTGDKIKILREEKGLTQKQLADLVNISRSALGMYESNQRIPKQKILESIAKALNTTPSYLIGWDEESNIFFDEIVEPQEAFKVYLQSLKWNLEEEVSNIDYENDKNGDAIPIYNGVHTLSKNGIIVQLTDDEFIALMDSAESDLNNRIIELAKAKAEAK